LFRIALILSIIIPGCAQTQSYVVPSPVDALPHALNSTVLIGNHDNNGICAGVIIQHKVLTAAHCISSEGTGMSISFFDPTLPEHVGLSRLAVVLAVMPEQDLAVLALAEGSLPEGVTLAPETPQWGRPVLAIGHPLGLYFSVTTGVVSNPSRWLESRHVLQVSCPITFGNSGGPVFNGYGELVGIASFMMAQSTSAGDWVPTNHLAMVVHLDEIRKILK